MGIADELDHDGACVTLPDGREVRLAIVQDEDTRFPDGLPECDGEVVYVSTRGSYTGHTTRPAHFDGAARIIERDRWGAFWWQPADDLKGNRETCDTIETYIRERFHDGWYGVVVELWETCDCCHRERVTNTASLWGVDTVEPGEYLHEIVQGHLDELGIDEPATDARDADTVEGSNLRAMGGALKYPIC